MVCGCSVIPSIHPVHHCHSFNIPTTRYTACTCEASTFTAQSPSRDVASSNSQPLAEHSTFTLRKSIKLSPTTTHLSPCIMAEMSVFFKKTIVPGIIWSDIASS
ncbi:MAG: hypothetical protein E7131_01040 [Rikenellaceae bacterium]|nr:hypothetical protein [Rikenellaceae bacterium]